MLKDLAKSKGNPNLSFYLNCQFWGRLGDSLKAYIFESGGKIMTKCEVRRWSLMNTDLKTVGGEIEAFLNREEEVKAIQTFIFQGQLILIAIFGETE